MSMLTQGFLVGMIFQFGLGPLNIATWLHGIANGYRESLKIAIGITLADAFYIVLTFLFYKQIETSIMQYETTLTLISVLLFLYLAHLSFKGSSSGTTLFNRKHLIFSGLILNLGNASCLLVWVPFTLLNNSMPLIFFIGVPLSTLVWLGGVPILLTYGIKSLNSETIIKYTHKFQGKIIGVVYLVYAMIGLIYTIKNWLG